MVEQSQRFVCIKIDVDRDEDTPRKYGVKGIPTVLFLKPNGDLLESLRSRKAEAIADQMKKVADDHADKKGE